MTQHQSSASVMSTITMHHVSLHRPCSTCIHQRHACKGSWQPLHVPVKQLDAGESSHSDGESILSFEYVSTYTFCKGRIVHTSLCVHTPYMISTTTDRKRGSSNHGCRVCTHVWYVYSKQEETSVNLYELSHQSQHLICKAPCLQHTCFYFAPTHLSYETIRTKTARGSFAHWFETKAQVRVGKVTSGLYVKSRKILHNHFLNLDPRNVAAACKG